jgi:hypothetical protein
MSTQGIKRSRYSGSSERARHSLTPRDGMASNVSRSAAVAIAAMTRACTSSTWVMSLFLDANSKKTLPAHTSKNVE